MRTTFYLVRHALKEKSIGDVPITAQGILQAQMTARYFSNLQISTIYTSPLRRAIETAEYIASATQTNMILESRLRERANWGDLPGQSFEEFVEMWEKSTRDPDYLPPIGDSAKQAGDRLSSLLSELIEKHTPISAFVLITHGGLITDFLVSKFTENQLNVWHPNFKEEQSNLIPECSITKIIYDDGTYKIDEFASIDHLQKRRKD